MLVMRKVRYFNVDKSLYDEYKSQETSKARRLELHYALFYEGCKVPRAQYKGLIENLEDIIEDDGSVTDGEATRLYRNKGLVPHPILV